MARQIDKHEVIPALLAAEIFYCLSYCQVSVVGYFLNFELADIWRPENLCHGCDIAHSAEQLGQRGILVVRCPDQQCLTAPCVNPLRHASSPTLRRAGP